MITMSMCSTHVSILSNRKLVMVIMQTELWSLLDVFVQGGPLQCDALVQSILATTVINNPTAQQLL